MELSKKQNHNNNNNNNKQQTTVEIFVLVQKQTANVFIATQALRFGDILDVEPRHRIKSEGSSTAMSLNIWWLEGRRAERGV